MKKTIFCMLVLLSMVNVASADSLWKPQYHNRGTLFTDSKAYNIGDIVTIIVSEATTAERSSETTTNKDVANKGSITSWLYPQAASKSFLSHNGSLPAWDYVMNKDFTGKGAIQEKDKFTAKITAAVIDIYPNGNMLIEGSREIMVANDKKKIIISGIIRRGDITDENTIPSNLIADAKIYYEGKGPIADNQRRGVFTWLRDMFSMF